MTTLIESMTILKSDVEDETDKCKLEDKITSDGKEMHN